MNTVNKLTLTNQSYPPQLRQLTDPPKQLYYIGDLAALLDRPRLAVIGSRRASLYGKAVTEQLVADFVRAGVVVISGLAFGIDAIAHRTTLEAGGTTIAVLPCGLDKPYPTSHRTLAQDILRSGGALISEYPLGTAPLKHHFIARNRIIAGLSEGVVIPEAAAKSGSLHTANFALEQGKTVFAVPGNITSPLSAGTNQLIVTGATPVLQSQDVLQSLHLEGASRHIPSAATAEEAIIISLLAEGITDASELLSGSELSPASFQHTMTMLELSGKIHPLGADHWTFR